MILAAISTVVTVLTLLLVGAMAYGRLLQTVKDQPRLMRLEAKLEIKEQLDKHTAEYTHDRASAVLRQAVK